MIFPLRLGRIIVIVVGIVVCIVLAALVSRSPMEVYSRIESPDGYFEIVVLRRTGGLRFPGSASDAPGLVRLVNAQGKRIHETRVEMVQQVDHVEWSTNSVYIKGVANWSLK